MKPSDAQAAANELEYWKAKILSIEAAIKRQARAGRALATQAISGEGRRMNNGGAKRFVARLIESGLQTEWLRALQSGQQPARLSGLRQGQGPIQQMHDRGIIKKAGKDGHGTRTWVAGLFLRDYLHLAERLQEARP